MNDTERQRIALLREKIRRNREELEALDRALLHRRHVIGLPETNPDEIDLDEIDLDEIDLDDEAQQEETDFDDLVSDISVLEEDENE